MNFLPLVSTSELDKIISDSFNDNHLGIAVFKHSSRCAISAMAKMRLANKWNFKEELPIYLLDLIKYRDLSNLIAEKFNVAHQSPQLLIIKNGICVYNDSHLNITVKAVKLALQTKG